jgi:hypothetical protein
MRKLRWAILVALALLVVPVAQAGAHKDPRLCGTITFRIGVTGPNYATLTKAWVHETVMVVKGPAACKEAKQIAGNDPYTLGNNRAYWRNGWLCDDDYDGCVRRRGAHDFTGALVGEIATHYRYERPGQRENERAEREEEEGEYPGMGKAPTPKEEEEEDVPGACWAAEGCSTG